MGMGLRVLVASSSEVVNHTLIVHAAEHLPALVVDCANCADPHRFYPAIGLAQLQQIYVFELELLHKFRDVLRRLPLYAKRLQVQSIIITTSDHLINYRDEEENKNLYLHAWQLMNKLGQNYNVIAGIVRDSPQYPLALKYAQTIME